MQSSKGCVRLRDALKCIEMHLGGHCYNRIELLTSKGAEKSTVASAADCEVADSPTAVHECKHNACRAELEVALAVIPTSTELKALSMCVEALLKSAVRHMQVHVYRTRHKADLDRLMTGALRLLSLAVCMCLSPQSVCQKRRNRL